MLRSQVAGRSQIAEEEVRVFMGERCVSSPTWECQSPVQKIVPSLLANFERVEKEVRGEADHAVSRRPDAAMPQRPRGGGVGGNLRDRTVPVQLPCPRWIIEDGQDAVLPEPCAR